MISAWWLLLIVPFSGFLGMFFTVLMVIDILKREDMEDETD